MVRYCTSLEAEPLKLLGASATTGQSSGASGVVVYCAAASYVCWKTVHNSTRSNLLFIGSILLLGELQYPTCYRNYTPLCSFYTHPHGLQSSFTPEITEDHEVIFGCQWVMHYRT